MRDLFKGPPFGIAYSRPAWFSAIMVLPFIAATCGCLRHRASDAQGIRVRAGATTWEVMWNVVVPHSRVGIVGGIMLGLGRALGETMAVTFVIARASESVPRCSRRHDDFLGHRQRVHGSGGRSVIPRRSLRSVAAVSHHLHGSPAAQAICGGWSGAGDSRYNRTGAAQSENGAFLVLSLIATMTALPAWRDLVDPAVARLAACPGGLVRGDEPRRTAAKVVAQCAVRQRG